MASTEPFDISKVLASLGVNPEVAKKLQDKMDGVDYLNLVNSLSDDSEAGRNRAFQILAKYGIQIRKVPQMENNRLESIFKEMHAGKDYDAANDTAFVRPVSEMESPSAAMSGYSSFVRAGSDSDAETLRDWLEENEFDYQNNDKHTFLVQSADRERTYRLNNFMSKMHGKTSMFDDAGLDEAKNPESINSIIDRVAFGGSDRKPMAQDEKTKRLFTRGFRAGFAGSSRASDEGVSDADYAFVEKGVQAGLAARKRVGETNIPASHVEGRFGMKKLNPAFAKAANAAMAQATDESVVEEKKKMAKDDLPKQRNPFAAQVIKKSGGGAHNSKDPARRDAWSRNAKHKGRSYESIEESIFTQGESVQFEGSDCSVQIPSGPNGTVGLLIDGKVRMVRESDITRVDEGVLGMTKVDPLYRLRELAGVKSSGPAKIEEDDVGLGPIDMDVADDFDDPMGADTDVDLGGDMDDLGGDDLGIDPTLGAGPELGVEQDPLGGVDDGEFGSDVDGMSFDADPAMGGGMPGDLPPAGMGGPVGMMPPSDSEAYTQIQDHLNNIQNSLGDVKLSEYRSLIAKLEALTVQVRSMGRDYLGEMRKLKK
ncbi:hypothetical protein D3C87_482700 [compost metagenome]